MAYATAADFIVAFGNAEYLRLTDRNVDATADPGVCEAALANASAMIDGYAMGIYAIPLLPVDSIVKQIALDLARWLLSGNQASERVLLGYQDANRRLADIAARRLLLTAALPDSNTEGTAGGAGIAYTTPVLRSVTTLLLEA